MVEAAGVAQVVAGSVPAPQRRGHRAAVDALAALRGSVIHHVWKTPEAAENVFLKEEALNPGKNVNEILYK